MPGLRFFSLIEASDTLHSLVPMSTSSTTPLGPSLPTRPLANPSFFSISASVIFLSSLIASNCLNVTTSKNFRSPPPSYLNRANSASASFARFSLAVSIRIAGFWEGSGNICCFGFGGLVDGADGGAGGKCEELESVDAGVTGPKDRRDAAN